MAVPVGICFEAETGEVNEYSTKVLVADEAATRLLCMGAQTVERRVQPRDVERIAHQDGFAIERDNRCPLPEDRSAGVVAQADS